MSNFLFKVTVILLLLVVGNKSFAQKDLIITQTGEEIRCKILDETPTRFVYAYLGTKNKVLRNEIFKNLVSSFKYGYYPSDILKNDKIIEKTKPSQSGNSKGMVPIKSGAKESVSSNSKNQNTVNSNTNANEIKSNVEPDSSLAMNNLKKNDNPTNSQSKSEENKGLPKSEVLKSSAAATNSAVQAENLANENNLKKSKETISPLADPVPVSDFRNYLKYRVGVKGGLGNIIAPNNDT